MSNSKIIFTEFDFSKLYNSVAQLLKIKYFIEDEEEVRRLIDLVRKMEIANIIHNRNTVAVAGMQGTGKTTLIKNLYDLPDDYLNVSSGRGETIPVLISESKELLDGQYKARIIYEEDGKIKCSKDIEPEDIKTLSHSGNHYENNDTLYIELLVPYKYFCSENKSFVLLPGFEKESQINYAKKYNSLMEYTLNFSDSVLLVSDDSTIANEDMSWLISQLNGKFPPENTIFAITHCDGLDDDKIQQIKNSLKEVCRSQKISLKESQIICSGRFSNEAKQKQWKDILITSINENVNFDFDSFQKEYKYYVPIIAEIKIIIEEIKRSVESKQAELESQTKMDETPEILRKALDKNEDEISKFLDEECIKKVKEEAHKKFNDKYSHLSNKIKSEKKFIFIDKSYDEVNSDNEKISEIVKASLLTEESSLNVSVDTNTGLAICNNSAQNTDISQSNLINSMGCSQEKVSISLMSNEIQKQYYKNENNKIRKDLYGDNFNPILGGYSDSLEKQKEEKNLKELNEKAKFYLIPNEKYAINELDTKEISEYIAGRFADAFLAMVCMQNSNLYSSEMRGTPEEVVKKWDSSRKKPSNLNFVSSAVVITDMLDGKPDILSGIVGFLTKSPVGPYIAAALCISGAGVIGTKLVNASTRSKYLRQESWNHVVDNTIEMQKNELLNVYEDAAEKLVNVINRNIGKRFNLGKNQQRLLNATYAINEIEEWLVQLDEKYAKNYE